MTCSNIRPLQRDTWACARLSKRNFVHVIHYFPFRWMFLLTQYLCSLFIYFSSHLSSFLSINLTLSVKVRMC